MSDEGQTGVTNCKAYVRGDQYFCDRCGLVWDLSDQEVPECHPVVNVGTSGHIDHGSTPVGAAALMNIKKDLNHD